MIDRIITVLCAILASSGIWAIVLQRLNKNDNRTKLMVGIAHDRIIFLGMQYIERGSITEDEYENLHDYLYVPYEALGGNGSAKRVMEEVQKLPLKTFRGGVRSHEDE